MFLSFISKLSIYLFANTALANIKFHWVQPTCQPQTTAWTGCLRGQTCLINGTCTSANDRQSIRRRDYSQNGQCGPQYGGLPCDANSTVYSGTCCSQYGWCGNDEIHCGSGCLSGCTLETVSTAAAASSTNTTGEPVVGQAESTGTGSASLSSPTTIDGTCGVAFGGSVCGSWSNGGCCSMYGWCGSTSGHCGAGCQSGPCFTTAQVSPPGPSPVPANLYPGSFEIVGQSGVPAMHAALMPNGRVVFLDKVENYTQLTLADEQYAYSSEYDPITNQAVPLSYQSNAFCSGGTFLPQGSLVDLGGNFALAGIDPTVGNGIDGIRYLTRSSSDAGFDGQDWVEPGNKLNTARWYASAQNLPNGSVIVASGSLNGFDPSIPVNNNPTYELLSSLGVSNGQSIPMDILEANQPYYMYPFMHLLQDGSLFILVAKSAELFQLSTGATIKNFPEIPGDYRTYPNTGGSVILAFSSGNSWSPDILVCGGGPYQDLSAPTDASCGRITPFADDAQWEMDSMPEGRIMVEGILLPDGTVIFLNGCSQGAQGFGLGAEPAFEVLVYDPTQPLGQRFTTGASSTIPRLYHSVAILLLDGTIMVAGSNPVEQPVLVPDAHNPYVTEFRVEIYTPPYLSGPKANARPMEINLSTTSLAANGTSFTVTFTAPKATQTHNVVLYHGGFITHNLHMGQRMLNLDSTGWSGGSLQQILTVSMPPNSNIAPPGPYVLYVVCDGVPGLGQFVSVS